MAQYEKVFTKPYEDGYENLPSQNTPITAQTLNDKDTAIEHIEDFLDGKEVLTPTEKTDFGGAVSDIAWYENNGFLSKNLFKLSSGNYTPTGISYIVNKDGTVTVNGYNSGRTYLVIGTITGVSGKTVRLTGCPSGGNPSYSETGYCMFVSGSGQSVKYDSGEGLTFVPDGDSFTVYINVVNTQMDNVVFKPMVSLDVSATYDDYTPYAPNNNELTKISAIGTDESGRTTASRKYVKGDHFYKDGYIGTALTTINSGENFILGTNYRQDTISDLFSPQPVAFTLGEGITNSNDRTRIVRNGNVITAYIIATYNQDVTSGSVDVPILTLNDTSLAPSKQVFYPALSTDCILNVQVNVAGGISFSKMFGTKYTAGKGFFANISWNIGA